MIIRCSVFFVKSAVEQATVPKQVHASENSVISQSLLFVTVVLYPSLLALLRCTEFLIRVDKGNMRIKSLSSLCDVD
jgi:hypothetical protein